jgi:hypothetical protein
MNTAFSEQERKHHLALLADPQKHEELFENAEGGGCWWNRDEQKWDHYPHILKHENSICNLYAPVRQMALDYFERHDIAWWQQDTDRYFPTGHLLSSQNHCLNHLMAIQRDKKAVMAMIKAICPTITDIYPSPIDSNVEIKDGKLHRFNSYITFEFTCDNRNLLHESGDKRGKKCTSVDALVYAKDKNKGNVLIPIEWKYTESYEKTPKERAHQESVKRYVDLANLKSSNLKEWILDYEWNPLYEFARQELLMERIIAKNTFRATDEINSAVRTRACNIMLNHNRAPENSLDDGSVHVAHPNFHLALPAVWPEFRLGELLKAQLFGIDRNKIIKPVSAIDVHILADRA